MRLLNFQKSANPIQWQQLYARNPGLADRPYADQLRVFCDDMTQYAGAMERTMGPMGYEIAEVYTDVEASPTYRARENDVRWTLNWRKTIPLAQARAFQPTVVWSYDSRNLDFAFLAEMKREVTAIEIVTGFIGSPSYDIPTFKEYDFLITCTDEYAETFRRSGIETYKASHVFDRAVLDRLNHTAGKTSEIVFSGGLARQTGGHFERDQVLEAVVAVPGVELYCPMAEITPARDVAVTTARRAVYAAHRVLAGAGVSQSRRRTLPVIGPAATWKEWPIRQINPRLYPLVRPPRYGLAMFQLLKSAKVVVDCVGTAEAANMRLFEATGVGSCLLTSWRPNLGRIFEPRPRDRGLPVAR